MGNCIGSRCALGSSNKKVSPDEYDQELTGSAVVAGKISSPPCSDETELVSGGALPLSALLKSAELQHSLQVQLHTADSGQRVKIVVNKKQLQLLKRSLEELRLRHVVVQSIRKKGKKWRPSLATIPEV